MENTQQTNYDHSGYLSPPYKAIYFRILVRIIVLQQSGKAKERLQRETKAKSQNYENWSTESAYDVSW